MSLNQLLDYPIMMLDRKSTTSEFLHQIFQKNRLDLVPEIELSSNDLLIDLARIGLGIAFVPDFCIPEQDKDLFILKLSETLPARQMVVAYNENLPVSQAANTLWKCCSKRSLHFLLPRKFFPKFSQAWDTFPRFTTV